MRHIILDSNIILQTPEILAQNIKNVKLIIPDIVLNEIRNITVHGKYSQNLQKLIYDSAKIDSIEVIDTTSFIETKIDHIIYPAKLSINDVKLVKFYKVYKRDINSDSVLATDDKFLKVFLRQLNLNVITSNELKQLSRSAQTTSEPLSEEITKLKNHFKKRILLSFIFGIILTVIVILIYNYFELIFKTLNVWGTIFIISISGFAFFYIRAKWRLFYGVTEFLVGIFTALILFIPSFDYNLITAKPFSFLQILGGVYIMVRGLDNIGKGFRATKFEKFWCNVFGESSI